MGAEDLAGTTEVIRLRGGRVNEGAHSKAMRFSPLWRRWPISCRCARLRYKRIPNPREPALDFTITFVWSCSIRRWRGIRRFFGSIRSGIRRSRACVSGTRETGFSRQMIHQTAAQRF